MTLDISSHRTGRLLGRQSLMVWVTAAVLAGLLTAVQGCGVPADIRLIQPQLVGRQQTVHLTTEQVCWAAGDERDRLLAEFPLPMAVTGRPMYLLYLRWPSGEKNLSASSGSSPRVRGFMIQMRGEYAGLASLRGGEVKVSGTSRSRRAARELRIDLTCEDGSRITGRLRARRNDWHVQQFETLRRPADVKTLE